LTVGISTPAIGLVVRIGDAAGEAETGFHLAELLTTGDGHRGESFGSGAVAERSAVSSPAVRPVINGHAASVRMADTHLAKAVSVQNQDRPRGTVERADRTGAALGAGAEADPKLTIRVEAPAVDLIGCRHAAGVATARAQLPESERSCRDAALPSTGRLCRVRFGNDLAAGGEGEAGEKESEDTRKAIRHGGLRSGLAALRFSPQSPKSCPTRRRISASTEVH